MKRLSCILAIVLLCLATIPSQAQFFTAGSDPSSAQWQTRNTEHFRIVYPKEIDSLAVEYLKTLEHYRLDVGRSLNYYSSQDWGKTPVILHPYTATSNGVVTWAPKRMDLYTNPQMADGSAMSWMDMLSIHEQRHVSQMQFGSAAVFKPFTYVFGEMWPGLMAGLYSEPLWFEGDAVVAETALTSAGRGREAEFLSYYRASFDSGDFRTYQKWKAGEHGKYNPNHYALGYMMLSGYRVLYNCPDISERYFHTAAEKPYIFWHSHNVSKSVSGKNISNTFPSIAQWYAGMWKQEMDLRAPFMPMEQVVPDSKFFTVYDNLCLVGGNLCARRVSLDRASELVKITPCEKVEVITPVSESISVETAPEDQNLILWTETVPDLRWELRSFSHIYLGDPFRNTRALLHLDKRLYNPAFDEQTNSVACIEHYDDSRNTIDIFKLSDYKRMTIIPIPDLLQVIELSWTDYHSIIFTAVSKQGYGLYEVDPHDRDHYEIRTILEPQSVIMMRPFYHEDCMWFDSDLNGVNELYQYDLVTGQLYRRSSTKYGSKEFVHLGDYLYYTAITAKGALVYRTKLEDLPKIPVQWKDKYKWVVADKMSEQEKAWKDSLVRKTAATDSIAISEPKKYSKLAHLFRIHSWAPFYADVNSIKSGSFDISNFPATLGAMILTQNDLGTAWMSLGYSAKHTTSPYDRWLHGAHLTFNYSGLYPVFEASLHFNDRSAWQYFPANFYNYPGRTRGMLGRYLTDTPSLRFNLKVYVPLRFNSNGWSRGVYPGVSVSLTNDRCASGVSDLYYHTDFARYSSDGSTSSLLTFGPTKVDMTSDKNLFLFKYSAWVRGYVTRHIADQGVYPRWGIGGEVGTSGQFGLGDLNSRGAYLYAYGYVPGFYPTHGIKLSSKIQGVLNIDSFIKTPILNNLPRGLSSDEVLLSTYAAATNASCLFTFDYAFPFNGSFLNFGSGFLSVHTITFEPYFDWYFAVNSRNDNIDPWKTSLYSVGGSLTLSTGSLIWLPYAFTIGITACYNGGGPLFDRYLAAGGGSQHYFVGPVVSVSF